MEAISMGKYQPLALYLENQSGEIWDAQFSEIERVLGFPLPRSALQYPAWWANQEPGHSQTQGWRSAGWETSQVDLAAMKVRFRRSRRAAPPSVASSNATSTRDALWEKARKLTGIEDRDALIEAALTALLRREAARQLTAMGGTMTDLTVPPRERPAW
jgi:hypothetical protein